MSRPLPEIWPFSNRSRRLRIGCRPKTSWSHQPSHSISDTMLPLLARYAEASTTYLLLCGTLLRTTVTLYRASAAPKRCVFDMTDWDRSTSLEIVHPDYPR